jgi:HD-GYP domain-containing protein (c-di-GMP phosphodiesterase class II)
MGRGLEDLREWVLAHHERPDGAGYPRGLPDEEIPLEAKILAVADAYEAMIADRVYRAGVEERAARAELLRCSGTQFDSRVVAAFLTALSAADAAGTEDAASSVPDVEIA